MGTRAGRVVAFLLALNVAAHSGLAEPLLLLVAVALLVGVFIRREMPESDVWLLSVRDGVNKRLGYVAALGQMLGPALRKTTALALSVTTFNMAAYWFKTIWLPTVLSRLISRLKSRSCCALPIDPLRRSR